MPEHDEDDLITVMEALGLYGYSKDFWYARMADGTLHAYEIPLLKKRNLMSKLEIEDKLKPRQKARPSSDAASDGQGSGQDGSSAVNQ